MHKQKQQNSMVQKPTKTLQPTNRIQPMQKLSTKTSNQTSTEKTNLTTQEKTEQKSSHHFLLGTKIGKCDICKATKKILL
jgi:hypothetical protein